MSKINNVRLPTQAANNYTPEQFNQLIRSLEQIVFQLNNNYTPQVTEDNQSQLDWFSGAVGSSELNTLEDVGYFAYGAFADFSDQTCSAINTATAITWDTTAASKHISVSGSQFTFNKSGRYKINFTAQLNSTSANAKTFWFWPRINGTDVEGSTMRITLHDNDEAKTVARSGIFHVDKGDYLEAYWAVDNLNTALKTYAAETFCPAVPSVTIMITSVEHG